MSDRRALLAQIHIAAKELVLDEELRRDVVEIAVGKRSTRQCTDAELGKVVDAMKAKGWRPGRKGKKRPGSGKPYVRKIFAMWGALGRAGQLRNNKREALIAFVKRMTGIDDPEWLDPAQAGVVIEALKSWQSRGSD